MIDVFTKYAWVKSLKDKTVLNAFIEILNQCNEKPDKIIFCWTYAKMVRQ